MKIYVEVYSTPRNHPQLHQVFGAARFSAFRNRLLQQQQGIFKIALGYFAVQVTGLPPAMVPYG